MSYNDAGARIVRLKHRRRVREGWQVPTLILDALLEPALLRPYWPQIEMTAELRVRTPHMRLHQVVDRAYSKAMLAPPAAQFATPEETRRRARNLQNLRAMVLQEARRYAPERILIVCQKTVEAALLKLGPLPPNVATAHHNNVAGRDEWRDVRALIVVGRTLPSPAAVERIAEALTGAAVNPLDGWYKKADAIRQMADGSFMASESDRHPDPLAEAIRWQICEGELIQIIGRARAVNRSAADQVDVLVLTDTPLPLPVDGVLSAGDLTASPDDLMFAEGGIAFENARHAATAYPTIWGEDPAKAWKAARYALDRQRSAQIPYQFSNRGIRHSSVNATPALLRVNYQCAGAGAKPCSAWFDPFVVPNPAERLRALLGPLASCVVADPGGLSAPPSVELPVETPQDPVSPEPCTRAKPTTVGVWTVRRTGVEPPQLVVCVRKPELVWQRGLRAHDEFRQMQARPREPMPLPFHMPRGPPKGAGGLQPKSRGSPCDLERYRTPARGWSGDPDRLARARYPSGVRRACP